MFGRASQFDRSLEKATSQLLLETDWDSIMQICDTIRQGDAQAKYALNAIRRKIVQENPHVSIFALQVLESVVKNCGASVHDELACKDMMDFVKDSIKTRSEPVKAKFLELIQVWAHAFRSESSYKIIVDTFKSLESDGHTFPTLKESDAMFSAEKAPEWKDGDSCMRCRTPFGVVQRKHHCRNCGEIFCNKCSARMSIIPRFGIEKEVRVCEGCYEKIGKSSDVKSDDELPSEYLSSALSKQSQAPPQRSEQEMKEEDELQLALAMSQSEAESKEKERGRLRSNFSSYGSSNGVPAMTTATSSVSVAPPVDTTEMDPELARYLNRNYWQARAEDSKNVPVERDVVVVSTTTPSAPTATSDPRNVMTKVNEVYQNGSEIDDDQQQFLNALRSSVEIFINRMRSNSQRGRSIATDSSVQSLFNVITTMHPQLVTHLRQQEDNRAHYESLQDKLAQLHDAREALNALREDYAEKRRREREEQERQKQIAMMKKLDIMRQKKHEYLEVQRQLALQRLQEQEYEMQMRFEQQKQLTQMRQMQNYVYPQNPMHPGQIGMDGSPVHQIQSLPAQVNYGPGGVPVGVGPMPDGGMMVPPGQYGGGGTGPAPGLTQPGQFNPAMAGYLSSLPGQPATSTDSMMQQPHANIAFQQQQQQQPSQGMYTAPAPGIPGQMVGVPQQGYQPQQQPPVSEYQPYNMQGMNEALPGAPGANMGQPASYSHSIQQSQQPQQQQTFIPGEPAPGQYIQVQAPGVPIQHGQLSQQLEGQLISFD